MRRSGRVASLLVLLAVGLLAPASIALAQGQAEQVLNQQAAITEQFQGLYDAAFSSGRASDIVGIIRQTSTIFFVAFFGIYLVKLSGDLWKSDNWKELGTFFGLLIFLGILIGPVGNTPPAMLMARGALIAKDNTIQSALQLQVLNSRLNTAIQTQVDNVHNQALLRARINQCEAIPATPVPLPAPTRPPSNSGQQLSRQQRDYYAKLECYQALQNTLQELIRQNPSQYLQQAAQDLEQAHTAAIAVATLPTTPVNTATISTGSALVNYAATRGGNDIVSAIIWIANVLQYVFLVLLNISYFLSILILPLVILLAMAPIFGHQSPLLNWLASFMGLLLTEFFYMIIVSLSSIIQTNITIGNGANADLVTALIFGVFGPVIAASAAKLNVTGAISAVSGGVSQIVANVPAIGSTAANFSRYRR